MKRPSPAVETADSMDFPPPAPPNHRKKKTRDLPNLSDCHCCNRRINSTNPKNRLQILASQWRIVLLCKCCYNLVESSQYCSYCLSRVSSSSMESFYECKRCQRRVHKACASMFSFGSGNDCCSGGFSVCFDCWIPKFLGNDYKARVLRSRTKSKVVKFGGDLTNSLGSFGVCDSHDKGKGENELNDVHVVAKKKIAAALEAKEKACNKALVAKKAAVLTSKTVGLVSVDKDGSDQRGSVVDHDALLAIRLHRAMNSSPRISRNSCLLNTHCVDVPEVNGCSDCLGSRAVVETSCSSKPTNDGDDEQNGLSENRQDYVQKCGSTQDTKDSGEFDGRLITYSRKGRGSFKVEGKKEPDSSWRTHSGKWSTGDERIKEKPDCLLRTYRRRLSKVKRCKLELGHCSKTYSRRHSAIADCKSKLIYGSFKMDNGTLSPAIALKCCEESRAFTTAS